MRPALRREPACAQACLLGSRVPIRAGDELARGCVLLVRQAVRWQRSAVNTLLDEKRQRQGDWRQGRLQPMHAVERHAGLVHTS